MSETKSYEDVLEDNREQEKNDVTDVPVLKFTVSPNYKGKNPKSPEELATMYEKRKAKREAKKADGLYESNDNMVSHPSHYQLGKYEVIDIIEEATKDLNGIIAVDYANALKYLLRWNKKGSPKQNLEKAIWEITHMIKKLDEQG